MQFWEYIPSHMSQGRMLVLQMTILLSDPCSYTTENKMCALLTIHLYHPLRVTNDSLPCPWELFFFSQLPETFMSFQGPEVFSESFPSLCILFLYLPIFEIQILSIPRWVCSMSNALGSRSLHCLRRKQQYYLTSCGTFFLLLCQWVLG